MSASGSVSGAMVQMPGMVFGIAKLIQNSIEIAKPYSQPAVAGRAAVKPLEPNETRVLKKIDGVWYVMTDIMTISESDNFNVQCDKVLSVNLMMVHMGKALCKS